MISMLLAAPTTNLFTTPIVPAKIALLYAKDLIPFQGRVEETKDSSYDTKI